MREGLRSGKLRVRPERDKILSEKKLEEADVTNDVNLDGGEAHVLGASDQEVVVPSELGCESVGEERPEVLKVKLGETESRELGESDSVELEQDQTLREHCYYPKAMYGSIAKRVKADDLDGALPFSGRVLRSMTIISGESGRREREEDGIISIEVKKKRGRPPKIEKAEVDVEKKDEVISAEVKEKIGPPPKKDITSTEVKKKRGRPPTSKKHEADDNEKDEVISVGVKKKKVKRKKRGRPSKIKQVEVDENQEDEIISTEGTKWEQPPKIMEAEIDENKKDKQLNNDQLPQKLRKKRGRPSKLETLMIDEEKCSLLNNNQLKKRGRPHKRRGRPPKVGKPAVTLAKSPHMVGKVHDSTGDCRVLRGKKSWKKFVGRALRRGKRGKNVNLKRHKINQKKCDVILENGEDKRKGNIPGGSRREEKQMVRDKIMRLIMGAGWTVQYRPREGRTYQDAVYVSPDGKMYWSITLAYNVLKRHYEEYDGKPTVYTKGFVFNPITDEELGILARITNKKRLKRKTSPEKTSLGGPVCSRVWGKNSLHGESVLPSGNCRRLETENNKRHGLLVRKAGENESGEEDYVLYKGKRTVLAWMIDMGVVPDNGVVLYRQRKTSQTDLIGWVTKDGIRCSCCDEVITIAEFEAHAGHESRNMALQNILLENRNSLLQCELTTWNKQEESVKKGFYNIDTNCDDPNDDTCGICGDGGNLVCCESCPSTFHLCCLGIKKSPSGDWHCPYCSCKYCGMVAVGTVERSKDGDTAISALNKCLLCEDKFHRLCVLEEDIIEDAWASRSFCGKKCLKLHKDIEGFLGVEHKLEEGYSCTLVRRFDIDFGITTFDELSQKVHGNSKVAVALSIMNECFLPADDRRSGINLIQNILYNCGSNFNRLNFSGFYTAILEKGDEMISVASVRIHGNLLAEMPFIGTRYTYRRQGMCRRLLTALESILCTLKIEKLVIPAIDELKETWTSVFGFEPARGELRKRMRNMNILAFPGVDMLQKQLSIPPALVENVISPEGPFSTQNNDVNKDGSDITNDGVQFSDSENGKNQITQFYESSDAKEKCSNIRNPIPDKHKGLQDLPTCLNSEAHGADVGLQEKPSVDAEIIPGTEPRILDTADKESLIMSLSNRGGSQFAHDQRTESPFSWEFPENAWDGKEGLVLQNGSLSPGEAFHDAEDEILSGVESPHHQGTASNGPCNRASSATCSSEVFPLQDIMVEAGPVFPMDCNQEPSAAEGTKGHHSGEFQGNMSDGKQGMAPVNGPSSPDDHFYDAKEETVAVSGSSPQADEKPPMTNEFEPDNTLQPAAGSGGRQPSLWQMIP